MFVAICHDHEDGRAVRNRIEALEAHLAYIESILGHIAVAGPIRGKDGVIIGSMLIYKTSNEAEARAWLEADPYFSANIWRQTSVSSFQAVAGEWLGGKTW
jgi:uncharacterized protein